MLAVTEYNPKANQSIEDIYAPISKQVGRKEMNEASVKTDIVSDEIDVTPDGHNRAVVTFNSNGSSVVENLHNARVSRSSNLSTQRESKVLRMISIVNGPLTNVDVCSKPGLSRLVKKERRTKFWTRIIPWKSGPRSCPRDNDSLLGGTGASVFSLFSDASELDYAGYAADKVNEVDMVNMANKANEVKENEACWSKIYRQFSETATLISSRVHSAAMCLGDHAHQCVVTDSKLTGR